MDICGKHIFNIIIQDPILDLPKEHHTCKLWRTGVCLPWFKIPGIFFG
jgi:hypothetical protein